ncbi:MAG: cyclic-di-AMP phosphodiesterase PgpH [Thermodesulfobacteriota bacterium]|nr:cyclic-di-AMP phosphodiesterase PgpH [Thermodesulfobacteriota bacterium]
MKLKKIKESVVDIFNSNRNMPWWILSGVIISFIIILYINLVPIRHTYNLGDIADKDIKASDDFFIEDKDASDANKRIAADKVLTIYDFDSLLSLKLTQHLTAVFRDIRNAHESDSFKTKDNQINNHSAAVYGISLKLKREFEKRIGFTIPQSVYLNIEKNGFSEDIPNSVTIVLSKILENGVVADKDFLLKEAEKGIILRDIESKNEMLTYELNSFYSPEEAKGLVRTIGRLLLKELSSDKRDAALYFVNRLIQPNITLNRNETEERIKRAVTEVNPVLYKVKAGEMLLREGEKVSEPQLVKLKALKSKVRYDQLLAACIGAAMILLCLLVTTYIVHLKNRNEKTGDHNRKILFFACVVIMFFLLAEISSFLSGSLARNEPLSITATSIQLGIPMASGAMLICIFMGLNTAISFTVVMSVCAALVFQNRFEMFIFFLLSGMMAAYWMQNCRERKVFIKAGVKLGVFNIIVATAMNIYFSELSWMKLLWDWIFAFLGGVGAGIVTAGLTPLVEVTFNFSTDIKLLELASLDQPVLRRLMIEAPGTYHHSVIIGSMVEAAASEIGANPLLAKVCGYYHDIGKINKPQYFIENQSGGINKHDKLAPSMSSLILVAHVKDGVELAKQNKLGHEITDTISQHHGTSLIRYFYDKAKQMKGEDTVKIDDFRYPGPKPQTREAGLVMLADVVESASRTLEMPTPARIQGLVQNLMNNIFSDGQLDNCELTLRDLHNIAKSFNTILNGIYHHRIEYSEAQVAGNGKGKDGSSDKQQAKQAQDQAVRRTANGSGHLKRLGLS